MPKFEISIVAKNNERALNLVKDLVGWLENKKIVFALEDTLSDFIQQSNILKKEAHFIKREEATTLSKNVVVIGGDGTLISVCRYPSKISPVIIGVNQGTLGFLTEITAEEMLSTVEGVLRGTQKTEQRPLLETTVGDQTFYAFNDIVVTKEALARIFGVEVMIDDEISAVIKGDGLIVAPPSGSTAYSLAAGGSIVHPGVSAILLTPLCPHSLTSRPLVIPGNSKVKLKIMHNESDKNQVYLTLDGQTGRPLHNNDEIFIKTSDYRVKIAKSPSKNYYQILAQKLQWAN